VRFAQRPNQFDVHNRKDMPMINMKSVLVLPIAVAIALAGCAAPAQQPYYGSNPAPAQSYPAQGQSNQSNQMGAVDRIEVINRSASNNTVGTIIGGIVGGLIGTQIGAGGGRTAATVVGAVGGAVAGNVIEGRQRAGHETFRVTVRMDNGTMQTVTQDNISDLHTGDRVRLDGNVITRL
jgi:outer membrane lipoprotein SlyB